MTISVWAPRPESVELWRADAPPVPMIRGAGGWWHAPVDHAGEYAFLVDGARLPDPRSPFQPSGIDGPSATVDHSDFEWSDQRWPGRSVAGSVIYELHVGTFTESSTFDGAIERLDHLVELGVDAVEVMPIAEFGGRRGWGYDGVLLWAPHHAYGGPEGFKRFVDACHRRGLAVILDVVYNHLGPTGNHLARFAPYFTDRFVTPWGEAVNLDGAGSDEVRSFIVDNATMWIRDYHVDGLRLDAVHAFFDRSAVHLLEAIGDAVHGEAQRIGRTAFVIAESDLNDPRLVRAAEAGGYGLDAAWSDDFHHALRTALTGTASGYYADFHGWPDVAAALERVYVYDGAYSPLRDRSHGRPVGELPRHRFLGYDQNHDQVGNTAAGARPYDHHRQLVAAAILLLGPFTPMLFQGEEWATTTPFAYFTDFADVELAEAVRSGRRREFAEQGWNLDEILDPQDPTTFEASILDWSELERPESARVLEGYRTLIGLRRRLDPSARVETEHDAERFVMRRDGVTVTIGLDPLSVCVESDGEIVLQSPQS